MFQHEKFATVFYFKKNHFLNYPNYNSSKTHQNQNYYFFYSFLRYFYWKSPENDKHLLKQVRYDDTCESKLENNQNIKWVNWKRLKSLYLKTKTPLYLF